MLGDCDCFASAVDLGEEWKAGCLYALGLYSFEPELEKKLPSAVRNAAREGGGEKNKSLMSGSLSIVNLVPDTDADDDDDENGDSSGTSSDEQQGTEAMSDDNNDDDENGNKDRWTESALQIRQDIEEMGAWIHRKQCDYVSVGMPDEEASLIQSTVTLFTAATANEIESLRQLVHQGQEHDTINHDQRHHRTGVVQILLGRLKVEVADPFGKLQKQRSRTAVKIHQHPLQCTLTSSTTASTSSAPSSFGRHQKDDLDALLMDPEEHSAAATAVDQRFVPRRKAHRLQGDLLDSYDDTKNHLDLDTDEANRRKQRRPPSVLIKKRSNSDSATAGDHNSDNDGEKGSQSQLSSSHDAKRVKPSSPIRSPGTNAAAVAARLQQQQQQQSKKKATIPNFATAAPTEAEGDDTYGRFVYTEPEELEREAQQLALVRRDGELGAVQKMEESMVSITTLLSQFAGLVSEQQDEVQHIHSATSEAKDDVDKGKEQLVEAKERTQQSRHYTASAITAMSFVLLFFHFVKS